MKRPPITAPRRLVLDEISETVAGFMLPVPDTSETFAARVFSYVEITPGCWFWIGRLDSNGYGVVGRGRRGAKSIPAHRAVWELLVGPIPPAMHFDHLCRNPQCVSPEHGEIVTPAENYRRGYSPSAMHARRDTCTYGHPKDGQTKTPTGTYRYCKTCRRAWSSARYWSIREGMPTRGKATHCKNGHEYTSDNIYRDPKRGHRMCLTCKRASTQKSNRARYSGPAKAGGLP